MDPNKIYHVKGAVLAAMLTAAAAGGYAAGEAELNEAQAKPIDHAARISADLTNAEKAAVVGVVNGSYCDAVEAELGLSAETCTAQKVLGRLVGNIDVHVVDRDDPPDGINETAVMSAQIRVPGTLTVSMP